MALCIYNTLNRKKELFEPLQPGKAHIYVCGPTVYDACHIGHARSAVVFDVIVRYLRALNLDVTYVRNFTDVDDKIIRRANELGVYPEEIAERYIREFYEDMDALNVARADREPRVTDHIGDIIRLIARLIDRGLAYELDGDVYYSVEKFKDYGKLSGRKLEEMMAGARVTVDERKRNPFDFALWKASKPGEPSWDSPWGKGRPGWHIECSAMSFELLGETFDIHGGGKDLIFPHHENEIAQSEGAFGKMLAKYWVHHGFVNINQEKMSKSLGNFMTIKQVIRNHHPEAVRLFLLSKHYRSPIDFNDATVAEACANLDKLYALLVRIEETLAASSSETLEPGETWRQFCDAMNDDFNTAKGLAVLYEAVRSLNRLLDDAGARLSGKPAHAVKKEQADIIRIARVLGILTEIPQDYFDRKRSRGVEKESIDRELIEQLVSERTQARKTKEFKQADAIRKRLADMNVILEDRPDGTLWKIKE